MTELEPSPAPANDTWEGVLANLRRRYPGQRDSVLFCIHKLQLNPDLSLRDFRAEADLHGIPMAGRSIHSARVLLGLVKEAPAAVTAAPTAIGAPLPRLPRRARPPRTPQEPAGSIETKVLAAVRQIQSVAGQEAEQLRAAIRQAIAILQRALDS